MQHRNQRPTCSMRIAHSESRLRRLGRRAGRRAALVIANVLIACVLVALAPTSAHASRFDQEVLGAEATVYRLLSLDEAGTILPAGADEASALALEISRPGEEPQYVLVPGTEDAEWERAPSLSYFAPSDTVHLVWVDQINILHSKIKTMAYRADNGFTEIADLIGNPFYAKLRPQVVVTQDRATWSDAAAATADAGESRSISQRVFHTVWREEQGHVFYSVAAEGASGRSARTETIDLSELLPLLSDDWRSGIDGPLTLSRGRDSRTVILTFIDPDRRALESIEIATLPVEMAYLADAGHNLLAAYAGGPAPSDGDLVVAAEAARSHIVRIGRSMLPEPTTGLIGREAATAIVGDEESGAPQSWVGAAEEARSHIVRIGRSLRSDGGSPPLGTIEFAMPMTHRASSASGIEDDAARTFDDPTVYVTVQHLSSVSLPDEAPAEVEIIEAADARQLILYWHTIDGGVRYYELDHGEWSEPHTLTADLLASTTDIRALFRTRLATSR